MKHYFKSILFTLLTTIFSANAFALPIGGQWAADRSVRSEWLDEEGLNRIQSINMVLCFVKGFWIEDMVGRGPFKAQVDEGRCDSQQSKLREVIAKLDITAAGPTVGHLWIRHDTPDDINHFGVPYILYANIEVFESPSSSNPNGRMNISWNSRGIADNRLFDAGTMTTDSSGFTMNTKMLEGSEFFRDRIFLSGTTESASGAVRFNREVDNVKQEVTILVGVNASTYCRQMADDTRCFLRSRTAIGAERFSWRYGLYDALGNRLDLPNPGFNIRGPDNSWGSANRFGVWNNSKIWANGSTVTQVSGLNAGKTFTYFSFEGKLEQTQSERNRSLVAPTASLRTFECTGGCATAQSISNWVNGTSGNPYVNTPQQYTYQNGIFRDSTNAHVVTTFSNSSHNGIWIRLHEIVGGQNTGNFSYSTGPNSWQKFTGIQDPANNNQYVTFSDPINFSYTPAGGQSTTLTFDGFGSSLEIPANVYTREDPRILVDQTIPNWHQQICVNGPGCIWIPRFLIDDQRVVVNGSTYFVQWLDASLSPAPAGRIIPPDVVLGNSSNLPRGEPNLGVKDLIGPIPGLSSTDPYAVIDGKLQ